VVGGGTTAVLKLRGEDATGSLQQSPRDQGAVLGEEYE
jgi:hypothetical protein